jgi:hypothetical protein
MLRNNLKIIIALVICLVQNKFFSQAKTIVNPNGQWYFGMEIGSNKVSSFMESDSKSYFPIQAGIGAEYYFSRHWSLSSRIKYYETGVSFYKPGYNSGSGFLNLDSDPYYGTFYGAVVSIPIDIKWEFRIYKNLGGSIKIGPAYNFETKSIYYNYSPNLTTDYPKQYLGTNSGFGLNYFINKKLALYFDLEYFSGASKGYSDALFGKNEYLTKNKLMNFGVKYNFKD